MIIDANTLPEGEALSADICIVGAGAVGIAMALDLIGSGLDVLLLEAGGFGREEDTQALYAGSVADPALHSPPDTYRERRLGGSTSTWGGRSMPFDPVDFEKRDYIAHSGWPIGPADLAPFYPEANRICEAGRFAYTIETAFDHPRKPMIDGFESANFTTNTLERFSCPTDFGRRYKHKLETASNVRLVLHANVAHIALDALGGKVDRLHVATLTDRHFAVRARHFVLANGGLEATRLLLASRDVHANGIGNHHDLVGRFYMCHVAGTIGAIQFNRPIWNGYDIADEGTYCRRRLALRPEAQHRHGIGNIIARLHHPRITDPAHRNGVLSMLYLARMFIPYEYGKRLHGGVDLDVPTRLKHLRNVLTDMPDTAAFMLHLLLKRRLAERKFPSIIIRSKAHLHSLDFHAEQEPNPASRITLSGETDALGLPRLMIDWRYTAKDIDTVSTMLALLAEDIASSGVGRFDYDPASVEQEMTRYGAYGGHHIGVTRMAASPRDGVVDADCTVHGVANLHIAAASVFPTSSQANPTLTVIAMGLRLARHLKDQATRPLRARSLAGTMS
ncbi:FAD-dependent oxidoreductase [Telmatospirillum siberiense]|uniref:GMC family oxidoreductase n=1 Tax=Telmatospirillum siberiense TaxID=382514 RepID=A0A2N3PVL1_9PROT|nr:GMC family oxidoreductase [Telmatospirillum siberiense]PKU24435.1 GMC family oxidoreductase [Telmatospirillum siberiense]